MKRKTILLTTFFLALLAVAVTPISASAREHHRFHIYFYYGSQPGYVYYQPAPAYYYYQPEPEYYYYQPEPAYYYYRSPRYRYYRVEAGERWRHNRRFEHFDRGRHRGWDKH